MIDELLTGCLEVFGHWIFGAIFLLAAIVVSLSIPSSEAQFLTSLLAYVLYHTAAMLIVGFGFKKAKRFLVITWVIVLFLFLVAASILASS